jgi:triosephosphate isomerase
MKRIPLIAANWKMHKTTAEAKAFITLLAEKTASSQRRIYIAPSFPAIEGAVNAVQDAEMTSKILIGAQNMSDHAEGPFTGEVSATMLKHSGARFVILGHSERRQYFAETNACIQRKVQKALYTGLIPLLCIGESKHERESGHYESVLSLQLEECLKDVNAQQMAQLLIAYEPIWAIGTGENATPKIAQQTHRFIRDWIEKKFGHACSEEVYLLYGGSVKSDNISSLMQQTDIDGVLVGGASLDVNTFSAIVNY